MFTAAVLTYYKKDSLEKFRSNVYKWILTDRKFTKLFISTTSSTLMSVGKSTEDNLGFGEG